MPLILFLLLLGLYFAHEHMEKQWRQAKSDSWNENHVNGYREYLLAWHIYWEDLVPEIFARAQQHPLPPEVCGLVFETFYPGSKVFDKLGTLMYGESPEGHANRRAKETLVAEGYGTYICNWQWDDRRHELAKTAVDEANAPVQYRHCVNMYILCAQFAEPNSECLRDKDIQDMLPAEDDIRRNTNVSLGGKQRPLRPQIIPWP